MLIIEMYNLAPCYDVWLCINWKEMEVDREQMTHFGASQTEPSLANVADQLQLSDDGTPCWFPQPLLSVHFLFLPQFFLPMLPWTNQKLAKVSALMNTHWGYDFSTSLTSGKTNLWWSSLRIRTVFLRGIRYNSTWSFYFVLSKKRSRILASGPSQVLYNLLSGQQDGQKVLALLVPVVRVTRYEPSSFTQLCSFPALFCVSFLFDRNPLLFTEI